MRWKSLDALRGLAALAVLLFHCAQIFPDFARPISLFSAETWLDIWVWIRVTPLRLLVSGPAAVVVFFTLSGFVLSLPFLQNRQPPYPSFLVRRLSRIYLPFAFAIFVSAALYALIAPRPVAALSDWFNTSLWDQPLTAEYVVRNLLMTGLRGDMTLDLVMWSLVHELRTSLVFPLLVFAVVRRPVIASGTALVLSLVCARAIGGTEVTSLAMSLVDTGQYLFLFVAGIMLAKYARPIIAVLSRLTWRASTGLWIVSFVLLLFPGRSVSTAYNFVWGAGAILLIALTIASPTAERLLSRAPCIWLGRVSYSLYLIHVPLMLACVYLLYPVLPLALIVVGISLPMSFLASEVVCRCVEQPSIRLGRWLTSPRQAMREPVGMADLQVARVRLVAGEDLTAPAIERRI